MLNENPRVPSLFKCSMVSMMLPDHVDRRARPDVEDAAGDRVVARFEIPRVRGEPMPSELPPRVLEHWLGEVETPVHERNPSCGEEANECAVPAAVVDKGEVVVATEDGQKLREPELLRLG